MFVKRRSVLLAGIAAPALAACASAPASSFDAWAELPTDPHSHARPNEARVRHVSLNLTADFTRSVLTGTATLDIETWPGAREIVLDIDGLTIRSVATDRGQSEFAIGEAREEMGAPLTIALPEGARRIVIDYETSPEAGALQWLTPAMTASRKPFLLSQGQSILTRTWVPTQDSPGVRQTYDARIVAPADLRVVMSAEMLTPDGEAASGGRAYRFRMTHPIPPYLIAIAVGELSFQAIGPRTGVWAEPSVIEQAAYECADLERMLIAAEALYGDYRWGRYDVLVLPPSFPYGGMENPRLTFLTPTFIAGDRSLVSLLAHELAHSWSGNLVTNAVWADFWLNESFTTYFEGRVTEALYGAELAAMQNSLAWADIQTAITTIPENTQRLRLPDGMGAEDYNAAIAYEKGALFLRTIEAIVGRARFDAYLRSYFDRHAFQPMTTARFLADFREHVVQGDAALEERLMLDAWVYEPGLPPSAEEPRSEAFVRVAQAVAAFDAGGAADAVPWESWGTLERQRFLQTIRREQTYARLSEMDDAMGLSDNGNSEVLFDWLMLAVRNGHAAVQPSLEGFLTRQGRRKFVAPLYRALMEQGSWGPAFAQRVYAEARPTYHPVAVGTIDRIMNPD